MNITNQKNKNRNITPNFIIIRSINILKKGKNNHNNPHNKDTIQDNQQHIVHTDRSSSKASKTSFEAFQKRVLHLGKLKSNLQNRIHGPKRLSPGVFTEDSKKSNSNQKQYQGTVNFKIKQNILGRKKHTNSGKLINRGHILEKTSVPKRNEESLQKQQELAKIRNKNLLQDLMKHQQVPNYLNKMKNKKIENEQRKKLNKKLLNILIQLKPQQSLNNYDLYGQLGKGAYGIVKMAMDKRSGEKVAVKLYEKRRLDQPNKIKNLEREINILSGLQYPTIAKLIEVIQSQNEIYLIMEYGGANSLYNYLLSKNDHRLSEEEAINFLLVIAQALQYLHRKNIVHRDIKAQNILLNRYKQLKLIDFGFSLYSEPGNLIDTFCGTPTYMAPQIVSKMDHIPIYTDIWSLGILLFVMLQGNYPFRSKTQEQLFQKIKKGQFKYIYNDISSTCKKLIENLLQVNPIKRLTIDQVLNQLCKIKSLKSQL